MQTAMRQRYQRGVRPPPLPPLLPPQENRALALCVRATAAASSPPHSRPGVLGRRTRAAAKMAAGASASSTVLALGAPFAAFALAGLLVLGCGGALLAPRSYALAAMQHLAAGLVTAAVAAEVLPEVMAARGDARATAAAAGGFIAGVCVMLLLEAVTHGHEDGDDDEHHHHHHEPLLASNQVADEEGGRLLAAQESTVTRRQQSKSERCLRCAEAAAAATESDDEPIGRILEHAAQSPTPPLTTGRVPPFPASLCAAVAIDALVDGSLLGLSSATVGARAALVLAAALTVEMGFLGATMAAALAGQPRLRAVAGVVFTALALPLGGAVSSAAGDVAESNLALRVGLLSGGMAALLYLVTEELLVEAHSSGKHLPVYVDSMFFLGFLAAILVDLLV